MILKSSQRFSCSQEKASVRRQCQEYSNEMQAMAADLWTEIARLKATCEGESRERIKLHHQLQVCIGWSV